MVLFSSYFSGCGDLPRGNVYDVLGLPPVDSAEAAVKVAIAASARIK
jgi:hypothetical protein